MFAAFNGHNRPGVGMVRPHRSRTPGKIKADSKDDDAEAKKPDQVELRSLRAAYYGITPSTRNDTSSALKSTSESKGQAVSKSRMTAEEHKHRGRIHNSSRSSSRNDGHRGASRKSYSRRRTEEYVYGLLAHRNEIQRLGIGGDGPDPVRRRRASETTSSSRRTSLSAVTEDDIMPADSVSQNGRRRATKREAATPTERPTLSRRSTTPARVPVNSDAEVKRIKDSTGALPKAGKQSSSIFGVLLRRNTTPAVPTPPRMVECLTCGSDDIPVVRSARLECGHRMCNDCLKRLFQMSVKDPAHMPPKCCTDRHIPLKHVEKIFDLKFKVLWNRKYQEYHTKDRIYCPNVKCGEWIKPAHFRSFQGRRYAMCPRCKTKVCVLCNSKMHKSQECPKDPEIAKLVEQAKEEGWQTCFNCRAIVERKEGCNHMTCRCQAEFCIMCGLKWKTCDCPWFNYNGVGDADQLNEINVPERIQVYFRRARGGTVEGPAIPEPEQATPPPSPPHSPAIRAQRNRQTHNGTYAAELEQRRRQERSDAALARRMQLANLTESDDNNESLATRQQETDTWGIGDAADHFSNVDFVQNAANVVMQAFGEAGFGPRGDRAAGRRRAPAPAQQYGGDSGLAQPLPDDESTLNVGPAPRATDEPDEHDELDESEESEESDESSES